MVARIARLAPVVGADRARLLAVGQRRQQVGELGVAVLGHELLQAIAPAPAVRLTRERERKRTSDIISEPSQGMRSREE